MIDKTQMVNAEQALVGREQQLIIEPKHFVNGHLIQDAQGEVVIPAHHKRILLGMGCFWGAERKFWSVNGVYSTAVGYAAGFTKNPSYEEVCSGLTGHNEVVQVVYHQDTQLEDLLKIFWESHDPTQGMRQGNDRGTQYRSGIYPFDKAQQQLAKQSLQHYQAKLLSVGLPAITTEILIAVDFYFAETYHQQYLAKNPNGYCGLGGTGVCW